jgi:hypothetical protein
LPVAVEVLEVAASRVVVRLRRGGTEVGTEVLVGEYRRQVATPGVAVAAVKRPDLPLASRSWPGAAKRGASDSAMIVPPMLSPPRLTGVTPG